MKDELDWKIMMGFARLRIKICCYLIDDGSDYQRLLIALAEVKASNTSGNLLN